MQNLRKSEMIHLFVYVFQSNMVIMIMAVRIMKEKSKKRDLLVEELW